MAAVAALVYSCKKDWECECTYQALPKADKTTQIYTIKDASRRTASNVCIHSQSTYTAPNSTGAVETYTNDSYCELK
jgi:hypothetical protein